MERLHNILHTPNNSSIFCSVSWHIEGSSIAKVGYPVMKSREASVSLEEDSRGRRLLRMTQFRYCASGSTWMTEREEPWLPKRLRPFMASKAALAIPMELHM